MEALIGIIVLIVFVAFLFVPRRKHSSNESDSGSYATGDSAPGVAQADTGDCGDSAGCD